MKKVTINGVEFCNFGTRPLSHGMELITCYPMPKNIVQDVLAGKYPGVYLNPSICCAEEFYGFLGTEDQYKKVYKEQKECCISVETGYYLAQWGTNLLECENLEYRKARKLAEDNYEDWWQVFKEKS